MYINSIKIEPNFARRQFAKLKIRGTVSEMIIGKSKFRQYLVPVLVGRAIIEAGRKYTGPEIQV